MDSSDQQSGRGKKPTTLYIIGNGFDLWHGIPSEYGHFKEYVRQRDMDVYEAVESYLPAGDNWSSLESAFAEVDVDNIIDDTSQFMPSYGDDDWSDSGHHDFQYEIEKIVERLSGELRTVFGEWIRSLVIPTSDTARKVLRHIDTSANFLTFNYTSTLQELYGVPERHVLHIHGAARMQDSELVLGHAWNPELRISLNNRHDIEEIDTRLIEANSILDDYFSRTFKSSEKLIHKNQAFFDHLDAVETVCVLGHSLSDVDLPYLQALLRIPRIAAANWYVACVEQEDRPGRRERLIQIGVDKKCARTNLWTDN